MGAYEEDKPLNGLVITVPEKTDCTEKMCFLLKKHKDRVLIVSLLLNIILVVALISIIIVTVSKCESTEVTETKTQKSAPCEDDWIWSRGKCYYFSTEYDTWNNSKRFCKSHNASLAYIDNKEELDFLFRYKGSENRWIGLRRTDDNTAWTWTNGTLYYESLFPIQRSSDENIEHVYLNHHNVKSEDGTIDFRWICNKM